MTEPNEILSCTGLRFRYGKKREPVFSDLDLAVKRGETVLLMGPSGCGKSSLAYCLAGLYPAYAGELEGEITLFGKPLASYGAAERSRMVSILFQNPDNQFCMDTVEHEILFALENINYAGDLSARVDELLALVGLNDMRRLPIHTLSGGTKQKLALATAMATEAQLLILDEPFANLDPASCVQIAAKLRELNAKGLTLLIVDHRFDYWRPFLTRVLILEKEGAPVCILPEELDTRKEEFAARGLFSGEEWLKDLCPPEVPENAETVLEAKDFSVFHGKQKFLSGVDLALQKGTVTALIGKNGAGKSSLLTALAGAGKYKGSLTASGRVGLVFQNPRFQFLTTTVEEEVTATLKVIHPEDPDAALSEKARKLLDEFGMLAFAKSSPYALSQGQQRRLALLAMLAGDRPILLMDEPTYAQDERSTRFILELLNRRVAAGLTAVFATHDLELAKYCANRILLLEDGILKPLSHEEFEVYADERRTAE